MQKHTLIFFMSLFFIILFSCGVGYGLRNTLNSPLYDISGVWSGYSILNTNTGDIKYEVNALIQQESITLSLIAQVKNTKFAFRLDLEYIEHKRNKYIFVVKDRTTTWLEQIRTKENLDIPVVGHFLTITLVKKGENQIFISYDLGDDYVFGTLFDKGI